MSDEEDEDFNPYDMIEIGNGLKNLEGRAGKAPLRLKQWRTELAEKKKALREASAQATKSAPPGTVPEKKAHVDLETSDLQYEVELAEIQVSYARDLVADTESHRSSLQSRLKGAMEIMRLSGYGGDA
jgi:hypothetical protein